jgi:hypothetical protein
MPSNPTIERPLGGRRRAGRLAPYRRERQEFGGRIQWEAVFFGLLAGIGFAGSLTAMVLGGLIAAGASDFSEDASSLVDQMATGGGAVAVAILAFAYLTGGYVAARMARFDGWRQGLGVWLLSVLMILAAAITAWIGGGELDPGKSISLPSNPIEEGPLGDGWGVLVAVALVVPLVFAVLGGVLGERFHRAVDRVGFELEPESEVRRDPEPEPDAAHEDEESRPEVAR